MTDIVDWLRAEAKLIALPRLSEAAAEIERLRAVIGAAKDAVREHDKVGSTSASRRATIIKLREALYRLKQTQG
jgi:hypothetical protein